MTFPVPQLDDIEFEQLAEQARALIPRYAPEWTDHNIHDPGITILELLAWIVDQQVYQIGLVSDRHLKAFAALLGLRIKAAQPACGMIWPNKLENKSNHHVVLTEQDLSCGERVRANQQPDLSFKLDADVHLTTAQPKPMHAQVVSSNKAPVDLTNFFQQPHASFDFKLTSNDDEILEIAFDQPLIRVGENPIALGIEVNPVPSAHADVPTPWGPLFIEYKTDNLPWRQVTIVEDRTFSLARTGVVLVKIPANEAAQESFLRFRFDRGFFPFPLRIVRVEINVLPIVQFELRPQRVIGQSNGMPNQMFPLELKGLPKQSTTLNNQSETPFPIPLDIKVAKGMQFETWKRSHDLSMNKPDDLVYQLDEEGGQIVFGNGVNGAIPPLGAQIQNTAHHITNGTEGNLAANLNWRVDNTTVQGAIFGSNPDSIRKGQDAWDLNRLMAEARKRVLERHVMLSNQDLVQKVNTLDGFAVARTDLLLRYHSALPDQEVQGTRTIVVTPWRDIGDLVTDGVDSERFLKEVADAIEPYRVLGERLTVITHQRVLIRIQATILIGPEKDSEKIKNEAIKRLNARLTDIPVAESDIDPWPLGRSVTEGEIKGLLAGIPDVIAVPNCAFARGDGEFMKKDLLLKPDEVAVGTGHEIIIDALERR